MAQQIGVPPKSLELGGHQTNGRKVRISSDVMMVMAGGFVKEGVSVLFGRGE